MVPQSKMNQGAGVGLGRRERERQRGGGRGRRGERGNTERREGPSEMAQWIKEPTTKPNDLSLIPRIHTMEGESLFLVIFL